MNSIILILWNFWYFLHIVKLVGRIFDFRFWWVKWVSVFYLCFLFLNTFPFAKNEDHKEVLFTCVVRVNKQTPNWALGYYSFIYVACAESVKSVWYKVPSNFLWYLVQKDFSHGLIPLRKYLPSRTKENVQIFSEVFHTQELNSKNDENDVNPFSLLTKPRLRQNT